MACYQPIQLPWLPTRVPCGTCIGCRSDQARDWAHRIQHEAQMHDHAWFLTLTYDNERIPHNGSLYPADLQQFFKALRRDRPPKTLSYFACGEYGGHTQRPHYHAVLFGLDFLDKYLWRPHPTRPVWRSEILESYWTLGNSEFSTLTPGSAAYVAGYVKKKQTAKQNPDAYTRVDDSTGELVDIEPEFTRMSLRPAIGKRWIEKYWKEVYPLDRVVVNGKEYKPPRYYDKWMANHHPHILIDVKIKRDAEATYIPETKLQAKETIHHARSELYEQRNKV